MDSIAITDHGAMHGAMDFYMAARDQGVKPIVGCEFYVASRTRHDRDRKLDSASRHLTVLAGGEAGYRNLLQLATKAQLEGFYYRPRIDRELLAEHSAGLICLSGCESGEVPRAVLDGNPDDARKRAALVRGSIRQRQLLHRDSEPPEAASGRAKPNARGRGA